MGLCEIFQQQIIEAMNPVTNLLQTVQHAHHRRILENYRRHVYLEMAGEFEQIVAPDMMVEEPVYRINWGTPIVLRGKQAIVDFYTSAQQFVMWNSDDQIAVADWGLADELTFHFIATGHILRDFGVQTEDPDAFYHYTTKQAFIWPYDEQARLIGEHLYVDMTSAKVERLNTDDVVTTDWVQQTAKALLRTL